MFSIEERAGPISTLDLVDRAANARATIAPSRGGMATRWSLAGRELFYLDEATFLDRDKNVRGGNPVLFPSPGKLANDRWSRFGKEGALLQHGFARTSAWDVVAQRTDNEASVVLALESNEATRARYPFGFRVELAYSLRNTVLRVEQRVIAASSNDAPMPFGFGFHPYFLVPDEEKRAATIETGATRAFDNVRKTIVDLHGIDLAQREVDLHLLDHGCSESELAWHHGASRVRLRASGAYRRWVVWTLAGKPFVCLEPWTCPGDALNTGEDLIELAPGETWLGFVELDAG